MGKHGQRGIADGWVLLIGLVVVLGLLAGLAFTVKSYLDGVDKKGYDRGKQETEAIYAKRDNDALKAANARIQALQTEARAIEAMHAKQVMAINDKYQKDKSDEIVKRDRVIAGLRDGTTRLYVQLAPGRAAPSTGSPVPEAGACRGGTDGTGATGILGQADSAFLVTEAGEADRITIKLTGVQAALKACMELRK